VLLVVLALYAPLALAIIILLYAIYWLIRVFIYDRALNGRLLALRQRAKKLIGWPSFEADFPHRL